MGNKGKSHLVVNVTQPSLKLIRNDLHKVLFENFVIYINVYLLYSVVQYLVLLYFILGIFDFKTYRYLTEHYTIHLSL